MKSEHFGADKPQMTVDEATGKFLMEHAQYLKTSQKLIGHCGKFLDFFGKSTLLSTINNREVAAYVAKRRALLDDKEKRVVTDSTINRELATLRKLVNLAGKKWEVEVGGITFRDHMMREPEARTRWITREEAERLIACADTHLKAPLRFALLTGVRSSNVRCLKWGDVSLEKREIEFRIKSNIPGGKLLTLPITDELLEVLESTRPRMAYKHGKRVLDKDNQPVIFNPQAEDYVFTYHGEMIVKFRRSFQTACKNAGIKDFRFHDLRHTAASWMVQAGVPIDLVQEILGHTQIGTTKKYAHRHQQERMAAMRNLTLTSQSRHNESKVA